METFSQILELDEDEDDHDFSRPMVYDYFEQAEKTFGEMDEAQLVFFPDLTFVIADWRGLLFLVNGGIYLSCRIWDTFSKAHLLLLAWPGCKSHAR